MAINKKIEEALNEQINAEMYSAYLYLSMGSWFEEKSLTGFAHWFRCQYLEENMHAMKMYNYVNERGGRVVLKPIEGPETEWKTYLDVFQQVAEHEAHVTSLINNLVALSREANDFASESFLMWYVDEQVEEEATADELVSKLKLIGDNPNALLMMDTELGARGASPNVIPIHLNEPVA
ncbi:MAG: ferritin [Spirochaetales bacterium]|nr:ferritin [Spirochaetales bacterium]